MGLGHPMVWLTTTPFAKHQLNGMTTDNNNTFTLRSQGTQCHSTVLKLTISYIYQSLNSPIDLLVRTPHLRIHLINGIHVYTQNN